MTVPIYPFQVVCDRYLKGHSGRDGTINRKVSSFASLSQAWECSANLLRHPSTRRVQIMVVISDTRPPQTQGS